VARGQLFSFARVHKDIVTKLRASAVLSLLLFAASVACVPPARAQQQQDVPPQTKAQKKAEAQLRVVHGTVINKDENPMPSAVVYLKNLKTLAVKTYIADDTANYRFSGLDPNVDYEIYAESKGMTSATRTISNFDTRRDLELTLKLTKPTSTK
jgi:Carboxypeptidase regulatory-like domain